MYTPLNKQTSFFVALSLILVLFSTCKKDDGECSTANVPTIEWQKTIGNNDTIVIYNVQQTTDRGYILAGYKVNSSNGNDYWIVKLNNNADIEWEKTYGGSGSDKASDIQQTIDGGYIVAGITTSNDGDVTNNNSGNNSWILKLNANGAIEWQKTYGSNIGDALSKIKQTTDGGYIAAGRSNSNNGNLPNNQSSADFWIIKIAADGNLEWSKTFGGSNTEWMDDIQQTTNGEYLFVGGTSSNDGDVTNNHGNIDWWIIKLQTNGNLAWQKTYGGSGNDIASCIQKTNDGHYIITGYTYSIDGDITNSHGNRDAWVIKIDDLGNILQQTTVGTNDNESANSILQTHDNNLLIAGSSENVDSNIDNIFIAALDTHCNLLWQQQIPQENSHTFARTIFETTDCGYMLFGKQFLGSSSGNDVIIKLK